MDCFVPVISKGRNYAQPGGLAGFAGQLRLVPLIRSIVEGILSKTRCRQPSVHLQQGKNKKAPRSTSPVLKSISVRPGPPAGGSASRPPPIASAPMVGPKIHSRDQQLLPMMAGQVAGKDDGTMASDWLDTTDLGLDSFALNFSTLITASPTTYGLDVPTAVALAAAFTTYDAALTISQNPATRTSVTVAAKDAAKAPLITVIRQDAALVQATPSVSNDDKLALGLPVNTGTPSPIPAPSTLPLIAIIDATFLNINMRYSDQLTPDSARKPAGTIGLELRVGASATALTDPTEIPYFGLVTRNPVALSFDAGDGGKQAYIAGRWVNPTGDVGPWSIVSNLTIPK